MKKVKFIYMNNIYETDYIKENDILDVFKRYSNDLNIDVKDLLFICKGKKYYLNEIKKIKI